MKIDEFKINRLTGTDIAVSADYDGDGKYDMATWQSSGDWKIKQSSNNQTITIPWGDKTTDVAVEGDYDADGKTDIAVWASSGAAIGTWQIRKSSTGLPQNEVWGGAGDMPVPAPYRR